VAARAEITFIGEGSFAIQPALSWDASLTPGIPAGVQADDILVLVIEHGGIIQSLSIPGWNLAVSDNSAQLQVFWRRASGVDVAPTIPASFFAVAQIAAFRGCETTGDPIEAFSSIYLWRQTSAAAPSIPTASDGDMLLLAGVGWDDETAWEYGAYFGF